MKQIKVKLSKNQIQKIMLSGMGFVVLVYVYFSFFLGPLNNSRDTMLGQITELQDKVANSKNELTRTAKLEKQAETATNRFAALKALEDLDTIVNIGGANQAMARFGINATFATQASKPSPTPGPRMKTRG